MMIESNQVLTADNARAFGSILGNMVASFLENHYICAYNGDGSPIRDEPLPFDNHIESDFVPSKGDTEMATKPRINQYVMIQGERHWITANTIQEFADKIVSFLSLAPQAKENHLFSEYAWNWYDTYSHPNIETATATTYKRQLTLYLIPAFDGMNVEDITTDDIQRLFNDMTCAKATKDKAKIVLNQILDAAVEDGIISRNPLKSKRIKITGAASKSTVPYSLEQMRYLVKHMDDIKEPMDKAFLAIMALHPVRLEEALGLKADDINAEKMTLNIARAVTHPTRNQPEIKDTKTDNSCRTIGLSALALPYLPTDSNNGFVFGGETPLSYTQVRRMCNRIKKDTGFEENITPIRFRTTVLTDLYDQTKDIKLAQAAAGHTTSAMTLKYYVKGRENAADSATVLDKAYTA